MTIETSSRWITLLIGILLSLLPWPPIVEAICPLWVPLILIYWAVETAHPVPIEVVWIIGIMFDVSQSTLLGEHAFALTIIMLGVSKMSHRLHMFPLFQKMLSLFFIMLSYQGILFLIQVIGDGVLLNPWYWMASISSMIVWPGLFRILEACLP